MPDNPWVEVATPIVSAAFPESLGQLGSQRFKDCGYYAATALGISGGYQAPIWRMSAR